jgi:HNH endonuclease
MLLRYLDCYTVDTETGVVIGKRGRPLKGSMSEDGYRFIQHGRRRQKLFWHQVVWCAANGPIPGGMEINHRNGVKADNRLCNLECVTRSENIRHAFRLGLKDNRGVKHPGHKLTEAQVLAIRKLRASGQTLRQVGNQYGVSLQTVHDIATGKSWSHLREEVAGNAAA